MGGVSGGSSTEGSRQAIIAANNSKTKGDGPARVVMAAQAVTNDDSYSVVGGYGTGSPSKNNIKWKIDSTGGNIRGVGRVESVSDFKDLAEYFESKDGRKIESGFLVTLDGDKIRKAEKGTRFLVLFLRRPASSWVVQHFIGTTVTLEMNLAVLSMKPLMIMVERS